MNCIIIDDDKLVRMQIEKFAEKSKILKCLASFESAVDAISSDEINEADIIFVDIEMPEMNGLEFIKSLPHNPIFIVISGKDDYAIEALNLNAIDYLLKPVDFTRFMQAVNKAKKFIEKSNEKDKKGIFIKDGSTTLIRLNFDDILWVEALENYVLIVMEDQKHTVHFTMKALEKQLPEDQFIRIHRSFIVNFQKITSIEDNIAIIKYKDKKKSIPIAKTYKEKLLKKINIISK